MAKELAFNLTGSCAARIAYVHHIYLLEIGKIDAMPAYQDDSDIFPLPINPVLHSYVGDIELQAALVSGQKWRKWTPKRETCQLDSPIVYGDANSFKPVVKGFMNTDTDKARAEFNKLAASCKQYAVIVVLDNGETMYLFGNKESGMEFMKAEYTTTKRGFDFELSMSDTKALVKYSGVIEQ